MEGELGPEMGAERYAQALREQVALGKTSAPASEADRGPEPDGGPEPNSGPEPNGGPEPNSGPEPNGGPELPVLDVVVLGIGPDGHIASLFPGAPTLDAGAEAICLGVHDSPKPPPQRITLSLAVLRAARRCLLPATGVGKRDAIGGALGAATHHVPASLLRKERLMILIDDAASPPPP